MYTKVYQVKEYNRIKRLKYEEDIKEWKSENRMGLGGMPFLPMYIYTREDTGMPRKKGYVISDNNGSLFCLTKKELMKKLKEKSITISVKEIVTCN